MTRHNCPLSLPILTEVAEVDIPSLDPFDKELVNERHHLDFNLVRLC